MRTGVGCVGGGRSFGRTIASVLALASLVGVAPAVLVMIARSRFGSPAPWSGFEWLTATEPGRIVASATTDGTVTDTVVAGALIVGWLAIAAVACSIPTEIRHLRRHGAVGSPARRGVGWARSAAAYIAAGLVAAGPLTPVGAADIAAALPTRGTTIEMSGHRMPAARVAVQTERTHVVVPGESVLSIAERYRGGSPSEVSTYATAIVDRNLGRSMSGGQRFTNPALVEPGWELVLPDGVAPAVSDRVHEVGPGDTLWDLAAEHLGDGLRWPEVWDRNSGRVMNDGRSFDDPHLIRVGWDLIVPCDLDDDPVAAEPEVIPEPEVAEEPEVATEPVDEQRVIQWGDHRTEPVAEVPVATADPIAVPADPVEAIDLPGAASPDPVDEVTAVAPSVHLPPVPSSEFRSAIGTGGAVLAGAVLALVTAQRRRRLRAATPTVRAPDPSPRQVALERSLRHVASSDPLARLDLVLRAAAHQIADHRSWVVGAVVDADGAVGLVLGESAALAHPFRGGGNRWAVPAEVAMSRLASCSDGAPMPTPALVELGRTADGGSVFLDLDAVDVLRIGPQEHDVGSGAADVLRALATSVATSVFARDVDVVHAGLGALPELTDRTIDASDGRSIRLRPVPVDGDDRAVRFAGEIREPGSVERALAFEVDGDVGTVRSSDCDDDPIVASLCPEGEGWILSVPVLGGGDRDETDLWQVAVRPVGLSADLAAEFVELVAEDAAPTGPTKAADELDRLHHRDGRDQAFETADVVVVADRSLAADRTFLVRLLGPVEVVDRSDRTVPFRRGKSRELIVWLISHRTCPTRTAARTSLWETDVRDATFANVLSEARRALTAAAGHDDVGWLRRGDGDQLLLHPGVVSDLDLVLDALADVKGAGADAIVERLGPLLGLVRGAPFHGTSYLWTDVEGIATRAVMAATSFATMLAEAYLELGDLDGVFEVTGAGLAALPGHEGLIALRLRAHAHHGDRASMREEWCAYERVLANDPWFDGEPAPALVALRRELLVSAPV